MLITMPQLGETVTEGTIVHWYKAVGDEVAEDEALFEVSTDKVDSEVPSPASGIVSEILVAEGDTVAIGTALAVVTSADGTDDEPREVTTAPVDSTPAIEPVERGAPIEPGERVGPGARVTREQVAARLAARDRPLDRPCEDAPAPSFQPEERPEGAGSSRSGIRPPEIFDPGVRDLSQPFSTIRRRTAEHMTRSLATSAHTLVVMEVDYSAVERARDAVRETFREGHGFGLSYLPFVARAVVDALSAFPRVNASVGDDSLIVHRDVHLGIAVDLDFEGLIVPVVRDAGALRLPALADVMHDRAVAARERRLGPDDLAGGTFTLTNAGGYGTVLTAPIISQPQVAIISTDGVSMRPVAVPVGDDAHQKYGVAVHPVGNLALSFDHRAIDGAYASAFLQRVVQFLEARDWLEELAP